jgi:hypothetical protein
LYLEDTDSNPAVFDTRKLTDANDAVMRSTLLSYNQDSMVPPAKKMRSLMESLFDDASSDEDTKDFENNNPLNGLEVNTTKQLYVEETESESD